MEVCSRDDSAYNFIVQDDAVRWIDFEKSQAGPGRHDADRAHAKREITSLYDQLTEQTGQE